LTRPEGVGPPKTPMLNSEATMLSISSFVGGISSGTPA
jgi:hypothetical protein